MRDLYLVIYVTLILGCKGPKEETILCGQEKEIFTLENSHIISLDTINSYFDFKIKSTKIIDSTHDCTVYFGVLYNFKDSNLIPNADTFYNIIVPCFRVYSHECNNCKSFISDLKIAFLPKNKIIAINSKGSSIFDLNKDKSALNQMVFNHFYKSFYDSTRYTNPDEFWTHVYIDSTINFKNSVEKLFSVLINQYSHSFNLYLKNKYGKKICDLSIGEQKELINKYHYKLLIDDFDLINNWDDRLVIPDTVKEEIELIVNE